MSNDELESTWIANPYRWRTRASSGTEVEMSRVLDIVPLRSLIAVADAGGFHRAAAELQLSQSAVSQHIRRLEKALGKPLVEPDGRRARLTQAGEALLAEARQIVAAHDRRCSARDGRAPGVRHRHDRPRRRPHTPPRRHATRRVLTRPEVKFRFDRTTPLNEAVDRGRSTWRSSSPRPAREGAPSARCGSPGAPPRAGRRRPGVPWPLIAIEEPCAIRGRARPSWTSAGSPSRWSPRPPTSPGC